MIDRRNLLSALSVAPALAFGGRGLARGLTTAQDDAQRSAAGTPEATGDDLYQIDYPSIASIDAPKPFGYKPASEAEKQRARNIINQTPKGPTPIDVAESFVSRFYATEPRVISQWPKPESWNPLVVSFFGATSTKATNDMIAWCAAFANWCLKWSGVQQAVR